MSNDIDCKYVFDDQGDNPDMDDCYSCKRERDRTCPFGIYNDTEITFPPIEKGRK